VGNKGKLLYCISNAGNSIFLIGDLFNDDKLQYDWQKFDISLCSMLNLIQENYISITYKTPELPLKRGILEIIFIIQDVSRL
jgi:hypothetical protein